VTGDEKAERHVIWHDEAIQRFWTWELRFPEHYFSVRYGKQIARILRRYIGVDDRVLDYGCGIGALTDVLCHDLDAQVWAADFLPQAVAVTSHRNRGHRTFRGGMSLEQLSVFSGLFDCIVAVEVIEHLTDASLGAFFRSASRVLESDGFLVVTTPNCEKLERMDVLCPCCNGIFHRWQHLRSVSATDLSRWGSDADLILLETFETDLSRRMPRTRAYFSRVMGSRGDLNNRCVRQPHLFGVYVHRGSAARRRRRSGWLW